MEGNPKPFNSGRASFSLLIVICVILIGAVLKIASAVILPFIIAVLLAFVMYPMVRWLDNRKIPHFVSIFLVVIILLTGLSVVGMVFFTTGSNILATYPKYENRITNIYIWAAQFFELPYDESLSLWENIWSQLGIRSWVRGFAFSFSNIFLKFISNAVLVILFIVFLLMEAGFFKEKLTTAFGSRSERISRIGVDLMSQVTQYLTAKFIMSFINGIIFVVAFSVMRLEFAILWGIIQFILNFIPALGSIVAGVGISLFALIQYWPDPGPIIIVVIIVLGANMICNILDPKIVGDRVGISPFIVLVSLGLWGWLWGFAGMILAVPMTVIVKIICENVPILEPLSIMIGSRRSVKHFRE